MAKSTAHRLLTTLCARGLAEKNPDTGMYRLGLRLFELGELALSRHRLRQRALPLMEELRQMTGCTVHLAVPDGADVLYLERLHALKAIPLFGQVGRRFPVHTTSSGRAIAAFNPTVADARRRAGFAAWPTSRVRSRAEFERVLEETRRTGVALHQDEVVVGLSAVAAPIRATDGLACAAISLVGLTKEFVGQGDRHARLVLLAASKLARSTCL